MPKDSFVLTRGPLAGRTVTIADQTRTWQQRAMLARILDVLGHAEALVTDMSTFADFELDEQALAEAAVELGLPELRAGDLLVDVAERLARVH